MTTNNPRPCPRCGYVRNVDPRRENNLCWSCHRAEPGWPHNLRVATDAELEEVS